MSQWALVVDVSLCINCRNCVLATKDEHVGNSFAGYSAAQPPQGLETIRIERHVRGSGSKVDVTYIPKTCNHCDDAPCVRAATDGSIYKRPDGIVLIDPEKAHGRRDLVDACPYGMIIWNDAAELPQHWSFDAHLLDEGWPEPRCSQACPTKALSAVKLSNEELRRKVEQEKLTVLQPELNTSPRVFYRHLRSALSSLVFGNVTTCESSGRLVNAVGVEVVLADQENGEHSVRTDEFGDFRFDGLTPSSARMRISGRLDGRETVLIECSRDGSVNLGSLQLRS